MQLSGTIAFSSGRFGNFNIWTLNLANGALQQLTSGSEINDHPRWSPCGQYIAFSRVTEDTSTAIWLMNRDGSQQRPITSDMYCQHPSWSPEGDAIVFTGNPNNRETLGIFSIKTDGSNLRQIFDSTHVELTPSVSPDGRCLLFACPSLLQEQFSPVTSNDIQEFDIATRTLRTIHAHPAQDVSPRYSPDGNRVAFISYRNERSSQEFQEHYDQYRDCLLSGSGSEARAALSKLRHFQADGDVYVSNRDGSILLSLTEDQHADKDLCWSPCGNYIMFTRTSLGSPHTDRLCVVNSHTGEAVPFTYDRKPLEESLSSLEPLSTPLLQKLVPSFIKQAMKAPSFWGAERHPDWTA